MKARRGVLGTLVMAGGDLCAMARTLCGRSTLLGKRGLSALGRAAATLLTQERHAQDMSLEIAADTAWPTRGSYTRRGSRARGHRHIGHPVTAFRSQSLLRSQKLEPQMRNLRTVERSSMRSHFNQSWKKEGSTAAWSREKVSLSPGLPLPAPRPASAVIDPGLGADRALRQTWRSAARTSSTSAST